MTPNETRREILSVLFQYHKLNGNEVMDTDALVKAVGTDDETQFWGDLQFLHDEEYVEGTPVPFERKGYLKSARISRKGVDLMDDPVECERMFPVKGVTAAVDAFLYKMRLELEKGVTAAVDAFLYKMRLELEGAELPDEEKTELFERLRRFTSHPLAARALNAVLQKYGQKT
jgi:hypothetical protein